MSYQEMAAEISYRLISTEVRKARKPHPCAFCMAGIVPGEYYKHERAEVDGELQVINVHTGDCWLYDEEEPAQ